MTLIELAGTFSFAVSGAFAAIEKKFDPLGVLIIAFVTAIGGGTIRDLLIGSLPVGWLSNDRGAWAIVAGTVAALFFGKHLKLAHRLLFLFDALGLGFFTMAGLQKGISFQLSAPVCIALGTITGCFGGVIRDIMLNNVPLIFHKEFYASASIMGGLLYFLLVALGVRADMADVFGIVLILITRILAYRYNWSLPKR